MIALAPVGNSRTPRAPRRNSNCSTKFLLLFPLIQRIARHAFRKLPPDERREAVQEVVANAYVAFVRLIERGKEEVAFATPLARFAIAQYRSGRRVGCRLNLHDVASEYCQQRKGVLLESLCRQREDGTWEDLVVEDKRSTPADIAATRIDFRAWLRQLDRPKRTAAKLLASGIGTTEAAAQLQLSPARISQLRRQLKDAWLAFQGEGTALAAS